MEVGEYKEPREEGRVVIQPSLAMKGLVFILFFFVKRLTRLVFI